MHYSTVASSHITPPIYTDRSSDRNSHLDGSWVRNNHPHPHLNPSKSKLNVKQFLNRSGEGSSLSNPNLENIKGSCFMANPPRPHHQARESFFEEKQLNANKIRHQMSFELTSKDSYPKFNYTPTTLYCQNDRKKSDSTFLRSSLREGYCFRQEEEKDLSKDEKAIAELRSQILSLTKKVFVNQEEIQKLKDRKDKQKKHQSLEQEFTQFQIQMFDICKKNTSYFSDFQDKIEKNSRLLREVKERCNDLVNKDSEKQQISKRLAQCETRLADLCETMRLREDLTIKNIAAQLNTEEAMMKKHVSEQLNEFKAKLQKNGSEKNDTLMKRLAQLEQDLLDKRVEEYFKKDNVRSYNSLTLETKQSIVVREGEPIRDRTNRFINQNLASSKKEFGQNRANQLSRNRSEMKISSKEQLLMKQNIYYIDPFGYLLDENQYYLLNSKNEKILVPDRVLSCLRENNMLILPNASKI